MPKSKKKQKGTKANDGADDPHVVSAASMPVCAALRAWGSADSSAAEQAVADAIGPLLGADNCQCISLSQSLGEQFTGGRSTPVYSMTLAVGASPPPALVPGTSVATRPFRRRPKQALEPVGSRTSSVVRSIRGHGRTP